MSGEVSSDRRIPLPWLLVPFGVVAAVSTVANAIGPSLITHHPLLQIALNPLNRYLILAAPQVSIVPFFIVGFSRLILTDPIAFVLGRQYGDAALSWAEKRTGSSGENSLVRRMEGLFGKAAPLFILIAPSFIWCLMAGTSRMRTWVFVTCNLVGTFSRLCLIWIAGDAFEEQLQGVLDFLRRFQLPFLVLTISIVTIQTIRGRQHGGLETPAEAEAEIEAEVEAEVEAESREAE